MSAFYLSEMAVSDRHGGGLTLQRVLGDDLSRFDALLSVGSFARGLVPASSLANLSKQFDMPLDAIPERSNFVRRFKPWFRDRSTVRRWETDRVWKRLRSDLGKGPLRLLVCPQWSLSVDLTSRAVAELGAEYITWVMDDHPLKVSGAAMQYKPDYEELWAAHLRGAHKVFVISGAMSEFYHDRFGVRSEVLHGAVPLGAAGQTAKEWASGQGPFRLGYAGSLGGWQRDALQLLAEAASACGAELHVAGRGSPTWLKKPGVTLHGELPQKNAQRMLAECDAVALPISFTPEHAAMSRLNIATKLSELCASGRPILAVGPADAAMIQILSKHDAAVCVTNPSNQAVTEGLEKVRGAKLASLVTSNARRLFEQELNLEAMQRRWRASSDWIFEKS